MKFKLLVIAIGAMLLSSCKKDGPIEPYSTFQNNNYKTIKAEQVDVDLNTMYALVIDNGYTSTNPVYSIEKNNEGEQIISGTKESHGWDGTEGLKFEIVRVQLNFDQTQFNIGDQLKVSARHNGSSESLIFKIH